MTKDALCKLLYRCEPDTPLAVLLERTPYDELLEIDAAQDGYRYIHHTDGKYCGIVSEGGFSRLMHFAAQNFVHPEDQTAYRAFVDRTTFRERMANSETPGAVAGEFRLLGTDGEWIWTRQLLVDGPVLGQPQGIVRCYLYDITAQKRRLAGEAPRRPAVRFNENTGLPEAMDFFRPAQEWLERQERQGDWCIIDLEIEQYKLFADWFGLESGRYLLSRVGAVLRRAAEEQGGMPGYLGHEEFCVILPYDKTRVEALYTELQAIVSSVSHIEGFSPMLGVAMLDGSASQIMDYYNRAALSIEELKQERHGHIRVYDADLHRRIAEEHRLLHEFQHALEDGQIRFWLQPQCRASNHRIVGAETLARWRRPDGVWVPPAVFVPILEKYSLVTQLDLFIWESVCRWMRSWLDGGGTLVPVSVNVSQIDIFSVDVPNALSNLMEKYSLDPNLMKVEITESAYAENTSTVRETVARLREKGFMVLMDDFGSGYSSLNMLRSLNVDLIKLDAQFLRMSREEQHKGISILESVVNMAKNLSTPIIVEGVETREQVEYLTDLGCRYVQGFYFHHPMPLEDFERLLSDTSGVDPHGFVFKPTQQLHAREFLDETIYSDAMLNNILGPVAFYNYKDGNVDIVRYNEQFYQMVGIEVEDMNARINHIQDYLYPEDRETFFQMLDHAAEHHVVGSRGVIRVYKPNGVLTWLSLQVYFTNEDESGKRFYASAEDVTELQYLSNDLPGGYYRCAQDEWFTFLFISRNFQEMTGFTEEEIQRRFSNRLINMVHPKDRALLLEQSRDLALGKLDKLKPYRVRRKRGDYIYVVDQCRLTDMYGAVCWQAMAIDITEVMKVRDQMRVLEKFFSDTILFLRRTPKGLKYEVAVHGLAPRLGLEALEFQKVLNSGELCTWVEGYQEGVPHAEYTERLAAGVAGGTRPLTLRLPDGREVHLTVRADRVDDDRDDLEYILILHEEEI